MVGADNQDTVLVAVGLPWFCGTPSLNGDVTRVVITSLHPSDGLRVENRLELPGQGSVGVCCPGPGKSPTSSFSASLTAPEPILLHSTSSSLTSYTINIRSSQVPVRQSERPSTPGLKPQNRALSSADPSPVPASSASFEHGEGPSLRKHQSFASLRDAQTKTPTEEKGFAKFLAAKKADWRGERKVDEPATPSAGIELGPGREVERDGGGLWSRFDLLENGEGLGLVDDAVEVGTEVRHIG